MKGLFYSLKRRAALWAPALVFMGAAIPAHASAFTSSNYYVGVEDHIGGDYDYNDFVFTLSGGGLTLNSSGTLSNPFTPNNNGFPFFDNLSSDGAGKNFGNCLYTPAPNACTGGSPLAPSAQYLSSGGDFVGFDFSGATGSVTFTLDAQIHGDNDTLYWCTSAVSCSALTASTTFTPGTGTFYFKLVDTTGTDHTFTSTDSNFAVALDPIQGTPEPFSLGLTGTGLIGLYFIRRRRRDSR
jgi:hypothetical protein